MNKTYILISVTALILFSSFKTTTECKYAGSNIGFAKTQTETAIAKDDINKARFFAYKALNAMEKSKKIIADCGCEAADIDLEQGLNDLKLAIKATSLAATKVLLKRSLEHTLNGLEAIEAHHLHKSKYGNEMLVMNTTNARSEATISKPKGASSLKEKIDISLKKYEASLKKITQSVDCEEARAFAQTVFDNCEKELLKEDLSEVKKYYNFRTKEITAAALLRIPNCL